MTFAKPKALVCTIGANRGFGDFKHAPTTPRQIQPAMITSGLWPPSAYSPATGISPTELAASNAAGSQFRELITILGSVRVLRSAHGGPSTGCLHPLDPGLNLSVDQFSLEVCKQMALSTARMEVDATIATIERQTGAQVAKRQAEVLTVKAAVDFDAVYASDRSANHAEESSEFLVLSVDRKGVMMVRRLAAGDASKGASKKRTRWKPVRAKVKRAVASAWQLSRRFTRLRPTCVRRSGSSPACGMSVTQRWQR